MRRRDFITLASGAAVAWPHAARGQQPDRIRRIGAFAGIEDGAEEQARFAAFLQGLRQLGWTDGRNVRIDYRWDGGDADNIRKYAAELAARCHRGGLTMSAVEGTTDMPFWRGHLRF
jgi:putative tryptophan/tyrosine transport system substrate-binding protein